MTLIVARILVGLTIFVGIACFALSVYLTFKGIR